MFEWIPNIALTEITIIIVPIVSYPEWGVRLNVVSSSKSNTTPQQHVAFEIWIYKCKIWQKKISKDEKAKKKKNYVINKTFPFKLYYWNGSFPLMYFIGRNGFFFAAFTSNMLANTARCFVSLQHWPCQPTIHAQICEFMLRLSNMSSNVKGFSLKTKKLHF